MKKIMQGEERYQDMMNTLNGIERTSNIGESSPVPMMAAATKSASWGKINFKKYAIYVSIFLVWSFAVVIIFHPSTIDFEGQFSWKRYFAVSITVFATLVGTFYCSKYIIHRFIR